jgi:hypothetical protein
MLRVDAPPRTSTPGQSISGAEAVGAAGWDTPGLAPEKKLETRLPNDGDGVDGLSPPPRDEQPDSAAAPSNSTKARR